MKYLFIGGSKDGQRLDVPDGISFFKVLIRAVSETAEYRAVDFSRPIAGTEMECYLKFYASLRKKLKDCDEFYDASEYVFAISGITESEVFLKVVEHSETEN